MNTLRRTSFYADSTADAEGFIYYWFVFFIEFDTFFSLSVYRAKLSTEEIAAFSVYATFLFYDCYAHILLMGRCFKKVLLIFFFCSVLLNIFESLFFC